MPSLGETFRITATITDLDGAPVTGGVNVISLYEPDGTLNQPAGGGNHTGGGVWTQLFTTAGTDPEGTYLIVWKNTSGAVVAIGKITIWIDDPPV
ncbi:unnamed protein product [marine sediment metagenome]|uniref:Big-1 domain-containing protein n=1 Tax=marine sediment metagenome TaxID=412755 RepID=X1DT48_9ZZZZ